MSQPSSKSPWAAIFDWDGVVIDSSGYHETSWEILAQETGRTLPPDHFKKGFGRKNQWIIPNLLGWTTETEEIERLSDRKEELYRQLVVEQGIQSIPGIEAWLRLLKQAGIPRIIGSSTHRKNIETVLAVISLGDLLPDMVSAEDVTQGKPAPDVFLKAAAKVDVTPDRCVVFEDAHVGIEAARNAGMKVVALTTTHPAERLKDADLVVDRLDSLSVEQISRWFS